MISLEVFLGFVFLTILYKLYKKKSNLPPGPRGLPFIGNVHQIGASPFLAHSKFATRYGDLHFVSMFGQPVIVLNSLEVMKECNFGTSDAYSHRPIWMENLCMSFAPGIGAKGAEDYHDNRKFVLSNLKRRGMGRSGLEPQILQESEQLVAYLKVNGELDPQTVLHNFTSNTIMSMCFGKRWDYGNQDYESFTKSVKTILEHSPLMAIEDFLPILAYLPSFKRAKKETLKSIGHIRKQFEDLINDRITRKDTDKNYNNVRITEKYTDEHNDIVSDYMKIYQVLDKDQIKNVVDICQDLFFGGSETTATTTNFAIVHMLNSPSWQNELFEELDQVLKGRSPSMSDLQDLPKMEATLQETLRMNPNVPLIYKANIHALRLREYIVPSNCLILINVYHINYDPVKFPNPTIFNPGHWLSPDGKFRSDMVEKTPTFGVGRRSCLGRPLARMEMFLLLAKLVQEFIFTVPDGESIPSGVHDGDAIIVRAPSYKLKLIKRNKD